uniref:Glycosyl transferase family 2 n=1 Tax=Geobacter sp. (strain M21) TaxID=443144 RepID=C6E3Z4_GEOSM
MRCSMKENNHLPLSDISTPDSRCRYVLITPARNEEEYIELTIQSMICQTVRPIKWVIVSDGSTDRTDEIVGKYLPEHPWMELIRTPERESRNFGGKVRAFNVGYESVRTLPFEIVGNLDADISFDADHFEFILDKFAANPDLGVVGTAFTEKGSIAYDYDIVNIEHVSGQCQIFRRRCYEAIGGYQSIKGGGIDWTAVTTARMMGWQTRTFPEKSFVHHRIMGTGKGNVLGARFRFGKQDYYLGGHPVWEIFRGVYQMKNEPFLVGGVLMLCGYAWGWLSGMERPISQQLVDFRRKEQMERLRKIVRNRFVFVRAPEGEKKL